MGSRATVVAASLYRAAQLSRAWTRKVPEDNRRYTPWMPFPQSAFISMLAEAIAAVAEYGEPGLDDIAFTEIGCGPGPNLLIARDLFGLNATGIDRMAEYTAAARSLGLTAIDADAETWTGYGRADITWFNKVARDGETQDRIESAVWRGMKPGSLVMCANLEAPPPSAWFPVLDDWADVRRGIWRKPDVQPAG